MKILTLKAKRSGYCNYPAYKWQPLGRLPPLSAELNEGFCFCCLFLSSLFWEGIRMVKCLFTMGMRIQEFQNYYFIYIYIKLTFHFLYFDIPRLLQALFMVYSPSLFEPLEVSQRLCFIYFSMFFILPFLLDPNTASSTHQALKYGLLNEYY